MRKILSFVVMAAILLPTMLPSGSASPILALSQGKALILSPISELSPMSPYYLAQISNSLTQAGYAVTEVTGTAVTLNLITTQLNTYDVVVWRTNVYEHNHLDYYYVGQLDNQTTAQLYANDFAAGWLDYSHGVLGATSDFFYNHLTQNSLSNLKLLVLVSSMSDSLASAFLNAGAKSVIYFTGVFSLQFGVADDLTSVIIRYLAGGYDVADAVSSTMLPLQTMILRDPLDTLDFPTAVFTGNSAITIT